MYHDLKYTCFHSHCAARLSLLHSDAAVFAVVFLNFQLLRVRAPKVLVTNIVVRYTSRVVSVLNLLLHPTKFVSPGLKLPFKIFNISRFSKYSVRYVRFPLIVGCLS